MTDIDSAVTGRTVLIVGASGLVGRAGLEAFLTAGWSAVAVSRRRPELPGTLDFAHLSVDLRGATATRAALAPYGDITHVVYAAAYEKPGLVAGWSDPEQMAVNRAMLRNVLNGLTGAASLRHVTLMQGTKAYGVHLHPIPVPARERHPRDPHENFYWLQEDLLRAEAEKRGFDWTIFRPVQIVGPAYGAAYCTPPVIGVLAAICHEVGLDFGFPGAADAPVKQVADVRLVADALVWAAESPSAGGEHFNLTNGEVFTWQELWHHLGATMGVPATGPRPRVLGTFLPDHAGTWDRIVRRYGLRPLSLADVLGQSHLYADYSFGSLPTSSTLPALVSTIKVKQAGFGAVRDTEETFKHALRTLVQQRVLPDLCAR
jgi:nucleoside-diphosphate-sugar epimerase